MRLLALPAVLLASLAWAAPAFGHAAYVGSEPAPGQRLEASPQRVVLVFTEPLNGRLARATLRPAAGRRGGPGHRAGPRASGSSSRPRERSATGAYRVDWHTVSTEDGHALEGAFSFGVRADAGAAPALETGPLARGGAVRISPGSRSTPRSSMLAAALLLPLLIGRPRGWPVPDLDPGDEGGRVDLDDVRARERRLRGDLAWAAVAAAVVATVADAADAARGIDPGRMGDYLAGNLAGVGRALVVVALVAAAALRDRRPRAAAGAVVLALGGVAASGHAGSAEPRVPSILNDWLHLVSGSLWLGGIGLLVAAVVAGGALHTPGFARGDRARGACAVRADRDRRVPRRRRDRAGLARHPARARRGAVGHRVRAPAGGQDRGRRADRGGELRARAAAAAAAARGRRAGERRAPPLDSVAQRAVARAGGRGRGRRPGRVPAAAAPARPGGPCAGRGLRSVPPPPPCRRRARRGELRRPVRGRGLDPPQGRRRGGDRARVRSRWEAGKGAGRGRRRRDLVVRPRLPPLRRLRPGRGRQGDRRAGDRPRPALCGVAARGVGPRRQRAGAGAARARRAHDALPGRRARAREALLRPWDGRDDRVPPARAGPARRGRPAAASRAS